MLGMLKKGVVVIVYHIENHEEIIMEEKKDKRVLSIELDENVKKVSITGLGDDNQVVMAQELDEEELDQATGGLSSSATGCRYKTWCEPLGKWCIIHGNFY